MIITTHVASGVLVGLVLRHPLPAFAVGVVSHLALDAVPHWGVEDGWGRNRALFLRVAVADGLVGLASCAAVAALAPRRRRAAVLAGVVGACLPDMDKPSQLVFGVSPFPAAFDAFHEGIQEGKEAPDRLPAEVARAAVSTVGALALLAALRGRRASGRQVLWQPFTTWETPLARR